MRILLVLMLALFVCLPETRAQVYYQLSFPLKRGNTTTMDTALLNWNNDGTGSLRLSHRQPDAPGFSERNETTPYAITEYKLNEHFQRLGNNDTLYWLSFEEPMTVSFLQDSAAPEQLYVKLAYSTDGYLEPVGMFTSMNQPDSLLAFGHMTLVELGNFSVAELGAFYQNPERLYQDLRKVYGVVNEPNPPTLFLIKVINTDDEDIAASCKVDADRIQKLFQDVTKICRMKLMEKNIIGNQYGKKQLLAALTSIRPSPNDVVVFYYSGHGFAFQNDSAFRFPQMDLRNNARLQKMTAATTLNVEEVFNIIKKKKPKFSLVLADCCNNAVNANRFITGPVMRSRPPTMGWESMNCERLFRQAEGNLLVTAARRGELAICAEKTGGFFTHSLVASLDKLLPTVQADVNWLQVIQNAQQATLDMSIKYGCDGKPCRQNPDQKNELSHP